MTELLALFLVGVIGSVALFLRHDAKERSRAASNRDWWMGWQEPRFLIFDYAGGQYWFACGLGA